MILSYQEYLETCKNDGLPPHNILSLLELKDAKKEAQEIAKWNRKRPKMVELFPGILWDEKMTKWVKMHHERRIKHMLNALSYAEIAAGFEPEFEEYLRREYTKHGLELPKI
jgi:hypothetical protein